MRHLLPPNTGIVRIDYSRSSTHGWQARHYSWSTEQRRTVIIWSRFFSDLKYGSEERAWEVAYDALLTYWRTLKR